MLAYWGAASCVIAFESARQELAPRRDVRFALFRLKLYTLPNMEPAGRTHTHTQNKKRRAFGSDAPCMPMRDAATVMRANSRRFIPTRRSESWWKAPMVEPACAIGRRLLPFAWERGYVSKREAWRGVKKGSMGWGGGDTW